MNSVRPIKFNFCTSIVLNVDKDRAAWLCISLELVYGAAVRVGLLFAHFICTVVSLVLTITDNITYIKYILLLS